jgi:hypothetical protein
MRMPKIDAAHRILDQLRELRHASPRAPASPADEPLQIPASRRDR